MEILETCAAKIGLTLNQGQLDTFDEYFYKLIAENRKINLTSIIDYEEVQLKHFVDSLTASAVYNFKANPCVIDIGTGAGFPSIPLKIVFPGIHLALLEATVKKAQFLERLINELGLQNVEIITGRAEEIAHNPRYREKYNVVLSRAVASLPALVEMALPFCVIGGTFIAYKKGDVGKEIEQSSKAIRIMGGNLKEIVPVNPELFKDNRYLVVIEKVLPAPEEYPRRPGMPGKRPLIS
jgi:16S rRNA (guanine527-N7)-methyltransferase